MPPQTKNIDDIIKFLKAMGSVAKKPLFGEEAKKLGYGSRKGFDFADVIDVPIRAGKSIAAPALMAARSPLPYAIDLAGALMGLRGKPYNSKNIGQAVEKAGITNPPSIDFTESGGSGWASFGDVVKLGMGRHTELGKTLLGEKGGAEPATVYEELAHARGGKARSALRTLVKQSLGEGLLQYLPRLLEETRAKGVSAKNVFAKEGAAEGLLSLPSLLTTLASYAIPHPSYLEEPDSRTRMKKYQDAERFNMELYEGEPDYFVRRGKAMLEKNVSPLLMKDTKSKGYMRAAMAQSDNPLSQLRAYFGI
jgi:hypothetical protein|tara:strand:- start:55 stop:978 length:924 start_codon:yes stop_codon:yes gene_type:complete